MNDFTSVAHSKSRWPAWALDAALGVGLAALGTCYALHITAHLDLGLYDETAYLQRGLDIPTRGLPSADMAPVYALWYWMLSLFTNDPSTLYFTNYGVTMVLFPLMFFGFLRGAGTGRAASLIVALCMIPTTLNVQNWPRVSIVALIILLAAIWAGSRIRDRDRSFAATILITLIATFLRPEFLLSVVLLLCIWLYVFIRGRTRPTAGQGVTVLVTLICMGLLFWCFGDPLAKGRSMIAFGQHYALNWVKANGSGLDPWTNWEQIVASDLGHAQTFSQAFVNAPGKVLWHIGMNVSGVLSGAAKLVLPAGTRAGRFTIPLLAITLLVILLLNKNTLRLRLTLLKRPIAMILAMSAPPLASVLLIHPREHYLLFPVCFFLALLIAAAYPRAARTSFSWPGMLPLLMLVAVFFSVQVAQERSTAPVLNTVQAINALNVIADIDLLDADGGYGVYLNKPSRRHIAQEKTTGFAALLKERSIDLIVASPRLMNDQRYRGDPEWEQFFSGAYAPAFRRVPVPGTETTLFVAEKALLAN